MGDRLVAQGEGIGQNDLWCVGRGENEWESQLGGGAALAAVALAAATAAKCAERRSTGW